MNQSAVPDVSPATLEVVPLGGVGEFGMNMMAVSWEDTTILIDAGVMFPEPDQLGVDLIIPDLTYVEARGDKVKALVLTHGHEDHIGAVPHVLPLFKGPVYGTAMTLALVEPKLEEHGHRREGSAEDRQAARPRHHRAVHHRVRARDAQHARLRGAGHHHACGRDDPYR
jgi:mRNA degradation ribonuclease J1/J2